MYNNLNNCLLRIFCFSCSFYLDFLYCSLVCFLVDEVEYNCEENEEILMLKPPMNTITNGRVKNKFVKLFWYLFIIYFIFFNKYYNVKNNS